MWLKTRYLPDRPHPSVSRGTTLRGRRLVPDVIRLLMLVRPLDKAGLIVKPVVPAERSVGMAGWRLAPGAAKA